MKYEVLIIEVPTLKRPSVMTVIMKYNRIGLQIAKDMVDKPPATVVSNVDQQKAERIQTELQTAGAITEIREM